MNRALRETRQTISAAHAPHFDVGLEVEQAEKQVVQTRPPDCPVCMEPIVKPVLNECCGHIFCRPCMRSHVVVYGKRQCPMCRATFDQDKVRALGGCEPVATPQHTESSWTSTPNGPLLELASSSLFRLGQPSRTEPQVEQLAPLDLLRQAFLARGRRAARARGELVDRLTCTRRSDLRW